MVEAAVFLSKRLYGDQLTYEDWRTFAKMPADALKPNQRVAKILREMELLSFSHSV